MLEGRWSGARQAYAEALKIGPATYALIARYGFALTPNSTTQQELRVLFEVEKIDPHVFVGKGIATWHKPPPFFTDAKFMSLANRHAHLLGLPNWHWALNTVVWAAREAHAIPGDFVELGVFKGHTTLFTAEYLDFQTWPKTWWLCDTFEGVPADQLDPGWAEINSALYGDTFSHEEVAARFAHIPNITVHKGRVPEALAEGCPEQIAFLHMDLNNTVAEIAALEILFDRLSPGGLIIFDDFGWAVAQLQNQAETAWFAERGLSVLTLPTGQGLFRKPS